MRLLLRIEHDGIDLPLPLRELPADGNGPRDVTGVMQRRFGPGIVDHDIAGLEDVVVIGIVHRFAVDGEDSRIRQMHAAGSRCLPSRPATSRSTLPGRAIRIAVTCICREISRAASICSISSADLIDRCPTIA